MAYRVNRRYKGLGAVPSASVQAALQSASTSYNVPLPLLTAVASHESSFNPSAVSSAGAQGLMQIMPATGVSLGLSDPFDASQSANAGAKYLSQLYGQYGDWNTALIAYNEGPGNLAKSGPFASSQTYASSILADAGFPSGGSDGGVDSGFDYTSADATGGLSGTAWAGIAAVAAGLAWWAAG